MSKASFNDGQTTTEQIFRCRNSRQLNTTCFMSVENWLHRICNGAIVPDFKTDSDLVNLEASTTGDSQHSQIFIQILYISTELKSYNIHTLTRGFRHIAPLQKHNIDFNLY